MKRAKKPPAAGKGRKRGVPNKATREAREAFRSLLEGNLDDMEMWLDRVARRNPARAFELTLKLAAFCVPQLTKTELVNDGKALPPPRINISFEAGGPGCGVLSAEQASRAYQALMNGDGIEVSPPSPHPLTQSKEA